MIKDKGGQMRIIEAMIACVVLIAGLSAAISFSSMYTLTEASALEEVGINILHMLDNSEVIEQILKNQSKWYSEFKELMKTLLPPDTYYNLTLVSATTGQPILQEITNLIGQGLSEELDVTSLQYVSTISFPYLNREDVELDIMLVIDRSGSMNEREPGDEYSKIYYAKEAAKAFVDQLNMLYTRVGLVSFSTEATLDIQLTNNSLEVKSAIDAIVANGYTNIGDGINKSNEEFISNGRDDAVWSIILLSDGKTNRPLPESTAREYALNASERSGELSIATYTIGLGADSSSFDEELLIQIATKGYYYAPSAEDLEEIYTAIARDLLFRVQYDIVVLQLTLIRGR